jgi:hypothetical protein
MKDAEFAHNEWLQALSDYGWIGLALVLLMVNTHLAHVAGYLRWFVNEKFPRTASLMSSGLGLVLGTAAALVAVLVHAVFEFHFHVPAVAVLAACLFGICANPGCAPEARMPLRVPGARLLIKVALLGASGFILWGAWTLGRADFHAERAAIPSVADDEAIPKLEHLSKAIALDPRNARFWHQRGTVRISAASGQPMDLARGLLKRAVSDLEEARRLNPRTPSPPRGNWWMRSPRSGRWTRRRMPSAMRSALRHSSRRPASRSPGTTSGSSSGSKLRRHTSTSAKPAPGSPGIGSRSTARC